MAFQDINAVQQSVRKADFQRCFETINFAQWAYRTKHHLCEEMENAHYFTAIRARLRVGDHIHVIDAAMKYRIYAVDFLDADASTVELSHLSTMEFKPVVSEEVANGIGLTWRWRGPRGGGHCIVDLDGNVVQPDFASKSQAEYEIERRKILSEAGRVDPDAPAEAA